MNEAARALIVVSEAAVERNYNSGLAQTAHSVQRRLVEGLANTWTTTMDAKAPSRGELIGRVDLGTPNDVLDGVRDFYIGTVKYDGPDYQVYSWAAPIAACTYYGQPADRSDLESVANAVVGVRTFAHRRDRIADFQDETVGDVVDASLFPRRTLSIPRAPVPRPASPGSLAAQAQRAPRPIEPPQRREGRSGESGQQHGSVASVHPRSSSAPNPPCPPAARASIVPPVAPLRASDLLRRQLAVPKTASMATVLATLQPDQYDVIARPVSAHQILQGHPGTGKTIIAAHRAAYLLNEMAPQKDRPRGRVMLLGPTAEYVKHIKDALGKLIEDESRYIIRSIPTLLEELAGLPKSRVPTTSFQWQDVDVELVALVDLAFERARESVGRGEWPTRDDIYAELRYMLHNPPPGGLDRDWVRYVGDLPHTYRQICYEGDEGRRGLLAYIGVLAERKYPARGHILVDEAQDVHPIEWHVLKRLANNGGWTILGDLNQRRTDHTFASWDAVAATLGIADEGGKADVRVLDRGYRSTSQIMKYATQLLPRQQRGISSLQQEGEAPVVTRVPAARDLIENALVAAEVLIDRFREGTVAIITVDVPQVENGLRRRKWNKRPHDEFIWEREGRSIRVLPPERARGLEFDAVVVIEPSDFPVNVGRQGVLYTALTRANRHLTVIHHRALPDALRTRR